MDTQDIIQLATVLIVLPFGWYMSKLSGKIEKNETLIQKTREEYVSKSDQKNDIDRVIEYIQRIEDKIDRLKVG
jgi:hypothetical protein